MKLIVEFENARREFEPSQSPVTIGRSVESMVVVSDERVSRRHLRIEFRDGVWILEDASSSGGTWSAGQRFSSASITQPVTIQLGHPDGVTLTLTPVAAPAPVEPAPPVQQAPPVDPVQQAGPAPDPGPVTPPTPGPPLDSDRFADGTVAISDRALRLRPPDGSERVFPEGGAVTVGRDSSCDVVIDDPLVSRQHLRFESTPQGWVVRDLESSRGTFIDDRPLKGTAKVNGSFQIDLGGADGAARLGVVTSGVHKKPKRRAPLVIGIAGLVIALVAVGSVIALDDGERLPDPADLVASVPLVFGDCGEETAIGSGSVVGDGLVLTNLHVVHGIVECGATPLVFAGEGERRQESEAAEADVVAVDDELDLAVLRVRGEFSQPAVRLGDSDEIRSGDRLRVLGYPGSTGGNSLTTTDGIVSGRVDDLFGTFITTDTAIAGGNSGGAAFDSDGRLVAVPTSVSYIRCSEPGVCDGASFGFLRPINEAKPLIDQAQGAEPIPLDQVPPVVEEPDSDGERDEENGDPSDDGTDPLFDATFAGVADGRPVEAPDGELDSADAAEACIVHGYRGLEVGSEIDYEVFVDGQSVLTDSDTTTEEAGEAHYCVRSSTGSLQPGSYRFTAEVSGRPDTSISVTGSVE